MGGLASSRLPDSLDDGFAEGCWAVCDDDACGFHGFDFVFGTAFAACDDGTCVAHAAAGGGCAAGDEACGGLPAALFALLGQEFGGFFFGAATDFADHDDAVGFVIVQEHVEHVDMFGALDRVATDADGA